MGGCATKPKVLTGDREAEVLAPAAAPAEPDKVEESAAADDVKTKEKGVDVVEEEEKKVVEGDKVKEIVGEHEDKPPSPSNLLKENEGKDGEAEEAESMKLAVSEAERAKEKFETKQPEVVPEKQEASEPEKLEGEPQTKAVLEEPVQVEQTTIPTVVVGVRVKAEAEKVVDVTPPRAATGDTQTLEQKKTEESK